MSDLLTKLFEKSRKGIKDEWIKERIETKYEDYMWMFEEDYKV
jgi:hypothetical protein